MMLFFIFFLDFLVAKLSKSELLLHVIYVFLLHVSYVFGCFTQIFRQKDGFISMRLNLVHVGALEKFKFFKTKMVVEN